MSKQSTQKYVITWKDVIMGTLIGMCVQVIFGVAEAIKDIFWMWIFFDAIGIISLWMGFYYFFKRGMGDIQ